MVTDTACAVSASVRVDPPRELCALSEAFQRAADGLPDSQKPHALIGGLEVDPAVGMTNCSVSSAGARPRYEPLGEDLGYVGGVREDLPYLPAILAAQQCEPGPSVQFRGQARELLVEARLGLRGLISRYLAADCSTSHQHRLSANIPATGRRRHRPSRSHVRDSMRASQGAA